MANIKKIKLNAFRFQPFSKKQMQLLTWWQEDSPVSDRFICVADGSIRAGKEQSVKSKLYTPDGFKLMGEIKKGDYVFNRKGNPVRVLDIFPQGVKDVYRVTFNDGSSCLCGKEHLWTYTTTKCIANRNYTFFTSTLSEIMNDLERFKDRKLPHQRAGKYRFPFSDCVEFNSREVKIDPYLLGLLLGDGCFTDGNCGITFTNEESELHSYIADILSAYDMKYSYTPRKEGHCAYGRLAGRERGRKTILREYLEYYSLYSCKSGDKFIPVDYKYNSKDVRLRILAGLINTDGSVTERRSIIRFNTTSKRLFADVIELARSLGMYANSGTAIDYHRKNPSYTATIVVNEELYNLLSSKHKSKINMNTERKKSWRYITNIEYAGKDECQCILVDDDEHLYLTDDFIVTHNTVAMITSFALYVMTHFEQQNAAICGKSIGTLKRNVVNPLKQICETIGYEVIEHRSENFLEIRDGDKVNFIYLFGGKLLATL